MPSKSAMGVEAGEVDRCMEQAASAVLETMFFTGVDDTASGLHPGWQDDSRSWIRMRIEFAGPLVGDCQLQIDREAARALACTLLCLDPEELRDEQPEQVAGELTNMICGFLLSHLEPDANLTLGAPEIIEAAAAAGRLPGGVSRWFEIPEGSLAVDFRLSSQQAV